MPLIEFTQKVYLRGAGIGAGDFRKGDRKDLPASVAERCVRNGEARYVTTVAPPAAPQATAQPTHPFVVAANVLRQQPTAEITSELLDSAGIAPTPEPETETDDPSSIFEPASPDPVGEGSDGPADGPRDPEPATCAVCGKDFAAASVPAVSLAAHRRSKGH